MRKTNFNNDAALQALKQGREEGLHFFFDNYYTPLNFFAQKLLNDALLAEEIVSDAFIKLWERREALAMEGSIKSFLFTIVRNECITQLRKAKRMRISERGLENVEAIEQSVLHQWIETETVKQIIHTMEALPPKCRQVFRLFYLHGKTYQEIAKELNVSPLTVRNQKLRAIELIKKMITTIVLFLLYQPLNH